MTKARENDSSGSRQLGDEQLNSWKAIAAYLKRDVSTVQRWEKREGLPVHRHGHRRAATAYAYRSEIDLWLETRSQPPGNSTASRGSFRTPGANLLWPAASLAAVAVGLAAVILWAELNQPDVATNLGAEPVRILISEFRSADTDADLAHAVEELVRSTLGSSAELAVVPSEAITETLQLMRKTPDSPIDAETALEVAQRQGDIRAVLDGRIEYLNGNSIFLANLRDPAEGITVAATSGLIEDQLEAGSAVTAMAERVRELVEDHVPSLERLSTTRLERVTTASLEALRLYSRAMESSVSDTDPTAGDWRAIELLLRQALTHDEEFPSAQILLAWAVHNQSPGVAGNAAEEYLDLARRAVAAADTASPGEGYFIRGSYQLMLDNYSGAVDELLQLAQFDPDHYWGINNLALALDRLGRRREAAEYHARRSDVRPLNAYLAAVAAERLAELGEDFRADSYSSRARSLLDDTSSPVPQNLARLPYWDAQLVQVDRFWSQGNIEALLDELEVHAQELDSLDWADRNILAGKLARLYLVVGMVIKAQEVASGSVGSPINASFAFAAAVHSGSTGPPAGSDEPPPAVSNATWLSLYNEAFWLARGGWSDEASQTLTRAEDQRPANAPLTNESEIGGPFVRMGRLAEAEILFARGQLEAAEVLFRELVENALPAREPAGFLAAESLASLYTMRGDAEDAVQLLEQWGGSQSRGQIDYENVGVYWMRNRLKLSEMLKETAPLRAAGLEEELRLLLAHADKEHFVAGRLRSTDTNDL